MKKTLIGATVQLLGAFLNLLSVEKIKQFADWLLDKIEDAVADSSNKIDDAILLPLITRVREALDIPDNDEAENPLNAARESEGDPATA